MCSRKNIGRCDVSQVMTHTRWIGSCRACASDTTHLDVVKVSKCTSEGETECTLVKVKGESILLDKEFKYVLVTEKSKYELAGTKLKAAVEDVLQVRKRMYYIEHQKDMG